MKKTLTQQNDFTDQKVYENLDNEVTATMVNALFKALNESVLPSYELNPGAVAWEPAKPLILPATLTGESNSLQSIPTLGVTVGALCDVIIAPKKYTYQLQASTEETAEPYYIRPADYEAGNNENVWVMLEILPYTAENSANKSTNIIADGSSNIKYPGVKAIKDYVDGLVVGLLDYRGGYDASVNTFPSTGGSGTAGAILKGDTWYINTEGTLGGKAVAIGDMIISLLDGPVQEPSNWDILNVGLGYTPAKNVEITGEETAYDLDFDTMTTQGSAYKTFINNIPTTKEGRLLSARVKTDIGNTVTLSVWNITGEDGSLVYTKLHEYDTYVTTSNYESREIKDDFVIPEGSYIGCYVITTGPYFVASGQYTDMSTQSWQTATIAYDFKIGYLPLTENVRDISDIINPIKGQRLVVDGDSIMSQGLVTGQIVAKTGCVLFSQAVSGTGYVYKGATNLLDRATLIASRKPNYILLAGGTNDWSQDIPLGSDDVINDDTQFYSAVYNTFRTIRENNLLVPIYVCTPIQRYYDTETRASVNTLGLRLVDYVNVIKRCADVFSLNVIDLYSASGITLENIDETTGDGLHPNGTGGIMMADVIIKAIAFGVSGGIQQKVNIASATKGQYASLRYVQEIATTTFNINFANGRIQEIVLTNGANTVALSGMLDGGQYLLYVFQPSSGAAGTVTWDAKQDWGDAGTPTLSTTNGKHDLISINYNARVDQFDSMIAKGF